MPLMLGTLHEALVAAGAPDDIAKRAAEEVAGYEQSLTGLRAEIARVRTDLRAELAASRTEMKTDIAAVRADIAAWEARMHRFLAVQGLVIVATTVTLIKLLPG